jgi:hypothetical protein
MEYEEESFMWYSNDTTDAMNPVYELQICQNFVSAAWIDVLESNSLNSRPVRA